MKTILFLLVVLTINVTHATADTYPRQPKVDAVHYAFQLALNDDNDEIIGEATITLRLTSAGVSEEALDLASVANGKGMRVEAVTEKGAPVAFKHQADRLVLTLATAPQAGELRQLVVRYRGVPANGYENFTEFLPTELNELEKLVGQGGIGLKLQPASDQELRKRK